ncbi:hypothetical protein QQP08_001426, partial [Theobroma cacao]
KAVGLVENCVPTSLSNDQESKEGQQEPWCNIPKDLLGLTSSYLVTDDRAIFGAVCRTWQLITNSPPPWLCSFRNTGNNMERCKFFHPMHNDAYEIRINPEVSNATILFSGYGWLLLSKGYGQLFLFDLTTKQSIDLPDCSEDMVSVMSFTSSPASPDCLVVGLSSVSDIAASFTYKLGEDSWNVYFIELDRLFLTKDCSPVFHKGLFYCLDRKGCLIEFNPNEPDQSWATYKMRLPERESAAHQTFMLEKEDNLLAVLITEDSKSVHVCKWDDEEKMFQPIKRLGDYMLFVSHGASCSERAIVRGTDKPPSAPKRAYCIELRLAMAYGGSSKAGAGTFWVQIST